MSWNRDRKADPVLFAPVATGALLSLITGFTIKLDLLRSPERS